MNSLGNREVFLDTRANVVRDPLNKFVMTGSEDIIEGSSMTDRDAQILGRANDEHVRPAHVVQRGTELRAATGGNEDSLGSVQMKTSSFGKDVEAAFKRRKMRDKIPGANSNIIGVETDVNLTLVVQVIISCRTSIRRMNSVGERGQPCLTPARKSMRSGLDLSVVVKQ